MRLINNIQHWPEEETQRKGPPHSARDIMVSPAAPTTPIIPRGASREGKREAVAVVASRAKPPERRVVISGGREYTV